MKRVYKLYTYTKNEGVAKTAKRTVKYVLKHATMVKQPIEILTAIDDVINADYIHHPYSPPAKKTGEKLKIGWVLSPLSNGAGGQNTIARFARFLQESGHDVTFYIYENSQAQSLSEAREIMRKSFKLDISVKKLKNYEESDALIATGWETTYPVFNVKTDAHRFYFVQDFEPYFYGVGSQYVL
ncbi:MAG: glycosyltransferase family 1 protein, partial [Pedobacter sp.]